jgi:hypothetical protein
MTSLKRQIEKSVIPIAQSSEDAITYFKGFCGAIEGRFTAFLEPWLQPIQNPIMKESRQTYSPSLSLPIK